MVGLAGQYLACRAGGADAGPEPTAAWEKFHGSCDAAIRRFAASFRSRGVDVEECAQQVWADLVTNLPKFSLDSNRGRFTSWLYTIVRSKATDAIRQQARSRGSISVSTAEIATSAADPADACERQSDRDAVRRAMQTLKNCTSDLSYQVLHLRWIDQLSVAEVGGALRLSPGQVWAREHRMKRRLKAILIGQGQSSSLVSSGSGASSRIVRGRTLR
jgi:RNA polymerase sigma factor (sigma-70 family)